MHENEEFADKTPKTDFKLQRVYELIDCISVIDTLAQASMDWLKKLEAEQHIHLSKTLEDLKAIRKRSKAIKHRIRAASKEAFGKHATFEARSRYAELWARIKYTLKLMQFFK